MATPDFTADDAVASTPAGTVIATWAGTNANSYVSVANADSFITTKIIEYSAWSSATSAQKAAALIQATQDIDSKQYIYHKYSSQQMLEFPRSLSRSTSFDDWDEVDHDTLETRMQEDVKAACCHQALFLLQQNTLRDHADLIASGIKGMERIVGPIREKYQYRIPSESGSARATETPHFLCSMAQRYLADWLAQPRIVRA